MYIELFRINKDTPIEPVFQAVNAEVDGPGELQEYGALNMKKKIYAEGLEKKPSDIRKWMKNQPPISDWPL